MENGKMQKILEELRANPAAMRVVRELFELLLNESVTEENHEPVKQDIRQDDWKIKRTVEKHMSRLGIPHHIKGYRYAISAITMVVKDPNIMDGVTKILYPQLAKQYATTSSRVERAIRHAIEVGFERCSIDVIEEYFGNTISSQLGKPTNSEFIALMADVVTDELI